MRAWRTAEGVCLAIAPRLQHSHRYTIIHRNQEDASIFRNFELLGARLTND